MCGVFYLIIMIILYLLKLSFKSEHNLNMNLKYGAHLPSTVYTFPALGTAWKLRRSDIWGLYDLINYFTVLKYYFCKWTQLKDAS